MNEEALRALVREAVARHLGAAQNEQVSVPPPAEAAWHPSHARYALPSGEDLDGPCLIEPAVRCNHCGYCQSHGH